MSEQFGAVIGIETSNSQKNVDNLIVALNSAAKSLFDVENIIKKYAKTSEVMTTSLKSVETQFKGIVDTNGKYITALNKNNAVNNKIINDNDSVTRTLKAVQKEFVALGNIIDSKVVGSYTKASQAAKAYNSNSKSLASTINKVHKENTDLGLNIATNVVGNYSKANQAAKAYNTNNMELSKTLKKVAKENTDLGLSIAGNVVTNYAKVNKAAKTYDASTSALAKTIRSAHKENAKLGVSIAGDVVGAYKRAATAARKNQQAVTSMIGTYKRLQVNILENVSAFNKLKQASRIGAAFTSAKRAAGAFFANLQIGHALMRTISFALVDLGRRFLTWGVSVHKVASDFLGFRNAIQVASGSLEQANSQMQYAIGIARKYKINVTETTKAYSKFVNAISLANIPLAEANEQFRILAQVGRVLNISTANMRGLFLAIEQMASKGFVSLEELRRQLGEHLPGAVSIAATAWGNFIGRTISVGEFMDMVANRTVETTKFLKPFTAELDKMTKPLVAQSLQKTGAAFGDLESSIELLAATIGTTLQPAFVAVANGLNFLVKTFLKIWPVADHLKEVLSDQIEVFEKADAGTGKFKDTIDTLKDQLLSLQEPIEGVSDITETFTEKATGLGIGLLGVTAATGGTMSILKKLKDVIVKYVYTPLKTAGAALLRFGKMLKVFNVYTTAIAGFVAAVAVFPKAMEKLAMAFYGTTMPAKDAATATRSLAEELRGTAVDANATKEEVASYISELERLQNMSPGEQSFGALNLQKDVIDQRIKSLEAMRDAYENAQSEAVKNYTEGGTKAAQYAAAIEGVNIALEDQKNKLKNIGTQQDWLKGKYTGLGMTGEDLQGVNKMKDKMVELNGKIAVFGQSSNVAATKFWILRQNMNLANKDVKAFADALLNRAKFLDNLKIADKAQKKIDEMNLKLKTAGDGTNYAAAQAFILKENLRESGTVTEGTIQRILEFGKALDKKDLIAEMNKKMEEFAKNSKEVKGHIHEAAAGAYILRNNIKLGQEDVGKVADSFLDKSKIEDEKEALKAMQKEMDKLNKKLEGYNKNANQAAINTFLMNNGFETGTERVRQFAEELRDFAQFTDQSLIIKSFDEAILGVNSSIRSFGQENKLAATKSLLLKNNISLSGNSMRELSNVISGLRLNFSSLYVGMNEAAIRTAILKQGIDLNADAAGNMAKQYLELARVIDQKQELISAAEDAARGIEAAFADFLFDPFENGLKGMLQSFNDIIARMAADLLAKRVMQTIMGYADTAFGGGGFDVGAAAVSAASVIPTGRASGGSVNSDMPYWVGETGRRELFIPETNGQIVPEKKVGGNGDVNNTYNVSIVLPGVQNVNDFEVNQTQIINRLTNAIAEKNRRR